MTGFASAQAAYVKCAVPECDNAKASRGYCNAHYLRLRRHGDPLAGRTRDGLPSAWIAQLVQERPDGLCRDWPFGTAGRGYAHRSRAKAGHLVLAASGRPRPGSAAMLHACDRPLCVAPWHLSWGTIAENNRQKIERGRHPHGESHPLARLSADAVRHIRGHVVFGHGGNVSTLAQQFGVSPQTVRDAANGRYWASV